MSIKFTETEMETINSIRQEFTLLAVKRGELEFQVEALQREIESVKSQYKDLTGKEQTVAKTLSDTYGPGTLNAETGEFTPEAK